MPGKVLMKNGKPVKDIDGNIVHEGEPFVDMFHVFHANGSTYNPPDYSNWTTRTPENTAPPVNPYAPPADTNYHMDYPPEVLEENGPAEYSFTYEEPLPYLDHSRPLTTFEKVVGTAIILAIAAPLGAIADTGVAIAAEDAPAMGAVVFGGDSMITEGMVSGGLTNSGLSLSNLEMTINDAPKRKRNRDLTITEEYPDLAGWIKAYIKKAKEHGKNISEADAFNAYYDRFVFPTNNKSNDWLLK